MLEPIACKRTALAFLAALSLFSGCGRPPQGSTIAPAAAERVSKALPASTAADRAEKAEPVARRYYDVLYGSAGGWPELLALSDQIDLTGVALEASASIPGVEVAISGVPTDRGKVRVAILDPAGGTYAWAMLRDLREADRIGLMTPVLPPEVAPGGDVRLAVYVRQARSPDLTLHLGSLPPAPADRGSQAAVAKLAEILDGDEITGGASSSFAPLVHVMLDDPGNPDAIANVLARKRTEEPQWSAQVDSVLATTGLVATLERYKAAARQLAALPVPETAAPYRTQATSVDRRIQGAPEAISLMHSRSDALATLREAGVDVQSSLSAAIAALERARTTSDAISVLLNLVVIENYLETMYRASRLPSKVTLYPPTVSGGCADDGVTYFPGYLDCSRGAWRVAGNISNSPVVVSAGNLKGLITAGSDRLTLTYLGILGQLSSEAAWEAIQNSWRRFWRKEESFQYADLMAFL
ncbi:MAG: hypothetical protein FJZ01_20090 [Candidatus Sericytochromatia bacterium]|nr:hypothetical protein [Candidatus Tanganyikabacteria bacterium]